MKVYALPCGPRCGNAGDLVGPLLVQALSGEASEIVLPPDADIVATGSILRDMPDTFEGVVWGTGLIFEHQRMFLPKADVRLVRGYRTKARINGLDQYEPLVGDSGLIACDLPFPLSEEKRYRVGVIPHYADEDNAGVKAWLAKHADCTSIDICARIPDVLRAISECEVIISSSLHGLIFADSFCIPNVWIKLSDNVGGGDTFKFRDYYSVFGITDPMPFGFDSGTSPDALMELKNSWYRPGLADIKNDIRRAFSEPINPAFKEEEEEEEDETE